MELVGQVEKHPVILDVDAGVDDAHAILLAMASPELEVVAITSVSGNVHVDDCTRNVLRVLSFLPQEKAPVVARGEEKPLLKKLFTAAKVHGQDGLGDLGDDYYPPLDWGLVSPQPATDLIPRLVASRPGRVTVIATGPITNVARAIEKAPGPMALARQIVVMGGAVHAPGNIPPLNAAEFNTYVDPEALQIVLDSGIPVLLVPLDVTQEVRLMRARAREELAKAPGRITRFAFDCAQKYMDFHLENDGMDGAYIHDALAVGVVADPTLVTTAPRRIYVETKEGLSRGMTVPYQDLERSGQSPNCRVAATVDSDRFLNIFLRRVQTLGEVVGEGS